MVAAFEAALDDGNLLTRMKGFAEAVQGLGPETLDESRALLVEKRSAVTDTEVKVFMLAWSRFDPPAGFAWAQTGPKYWRPILESSALYAWGYRDPHGASEALDALDSEKRRLMRPSLVKGWARSGDEKGATDYVLSLEPSKSRMRLVNTLVTEINKGGIEATIAWADGVLANGPSKGKEGPFRGAIRFVTRKDTARATAWFEAHQSEPYANAGIKGMALQWIDDQDPPALFAWLETLHAGKTRDDGMRTGFTRWWKTDPEAADAWIRAAEISGAHDPAVVVYAQNMSHSSPELAIEWADRIHDETLRRRTLAPVLRGWSQQDPSAVRSWMDEHDVPPEVRDAIVKSPRYKRMEQGIEEPQNQLRRRQQQVGRTPRIQRGLGGGNRGQPAGRQNGRRQPPQSEQRPGDGTEEPASDS
jgi:hypothetical protein